MDSDQAFSAVLYLRPNLQTEQLPSLLESEMPNVKKLIKECPKQNVERSFPQIGDGIVESLMSLFPNSIRTTIDSDSSYNNLLSNIKDAPKPFIQQVYIVEIPEDFETKYFDSMVSNIDEQFSKRTFGKHMSALVGTPAPVSERRNLAIKP